MSTYPVIKNPNSILREKSRLLSDEEIQSDEIQKLIDDMMETMKVENGVGIAAPQVGKHLRLIIAETPNGPDAFINPKIVSCSQKMVDSEEGCLSVPDVYGIVRRHKEVKVKAKNRHGENITIKTNKFLGIILQHEIDHLEGVLFIDRVEKMIRGESNNAI